MKKSAYARGKSSCMSICNSQYGVDSGSDPMTEKMYNKTARKMNLKVEDSALHNSAINTTAKNHRG